MSAEPPSGLPFKTKVALWFVGLLAAGLLALTIRIAGATLGAPEAMPFLLLYVLLALGMVAGFVGVLRKTDWGWWLLVLELGLFLGLGLLSSVSLAFMLQRLSDVPSVFLLMAVGQSVGLLVLTGTPFLLLIVDRKSYAPAVRNRWRRK